MTSKLDDMLRFHQTALNLRGHRQQLLAANIANADTPAFKARDFDFASALQGALAPRVPAVRLALTAPRHFIGSSRGAGVQALYRQPLQPSIDGNTVEMDVERTQFADNAIHYEANLTFVSGQIKSMLAAIQG